MDSFRLKQDHYYKIWVFSTASLVGEMLYCYVIPYC